MKIYYCFAFLFFCNLLEGQRIKSTAFVNGQPISFSGLSFENKTPDQWTFYFEDAAPLDVHLQTDRLLVNGKEVLFQKQTDNSFRPLTSIENNTPLQLDFDPATRRIQLYNYDKLDVGVYFYGKGMACEKFDADLPNPFFDPSKPTVLYAHGLQTGSMARQFRESFLLEFKDVHVFTHENWLAEGWNVGVFYWIQLADEPTPWQAEAKMNSTASKVGMRWQKADGTFEEIKTPNKTVAALFADNYQAIFNESYQGKEIRLTGNSFGGQLVLQTCGELLKRTVNRMPERICLLDPAWSPKAFQGYDKELGEKWTGDVSTAIARRLKLEHQMAIEYYRTSILTTFTTPGNLAGLAAFQHLQLGYTWSIANKHTFSVQHYFWSNAFDPPLELKKRFLGKGKPTGAVSLSASTSNVRVKAMMTDQQHWKHRKGENTPVPEDDMFLKRKKRY